VLSGIRAVLCEPIEDARDVHLDLPAANSLKGYATGRSFGCAKLIVLARQQADAGAFPQRPPPKYAACCVLPPS
jgi:hypothetical protein